VNVAVVLEAARILAKLKTPLRRTVRFAFWDGEEVGELGSRGYVATHLVNQRSGQRLPEYDRLSCYFNLDYGAGRIRGVYLQGRTELRPILQSWLDAMGEGGLIASPQSTLGSDQASFERIGIPGLSFIQDPLNYEIRSHHTNMDNPDYVSPEDLKHSTNILTQLVYHTAIADEMLPRGEPGSSPT
jgi:Zn-dependent M28 family amino/carboxypeptidase